MSIRKYLRSHKTVHLFTEQYCSIVGTIVDTINNIWSTTVQCCSITKPIAIFSPCIKLLYIICKKCFGFKDGQNKFVLLGDIFCSHAFNWKNIMIDSTPRSPFIQTFTMLTSEHLSLKCIFWKEVTRKH